MCPTQIRETSQCTKQAKVMNFSFNNKDLGRLVSFLIKKTLNLLMHPKKEKEKKKKKKESYFFNQPHSLLSVLN